MHIRTDISLNLDPEYILSKMEKRSIKSFMRPRMKDKFYNVLETFGDLVEPKLMWSRFNVVKVNERRLYLDTGHDIGGGPGVGILEGSQELLIGAGTIGPGVDNEMDQSHRNKDLMREIILDALGSWAVSQILQDFEIELTTTLKREGLYRSICITPGSIDWPIQDQAIVFDLLKPDRLGMSLTESMLMIPQKSLSFVFGISDSPFGLNDKTKCDFCHRKDTCRYRKSVETADKVR